MDDPHFRSAQHERFRGPDYTVEGQLLRLAPKTLRKLAGSELAGSGLVKVWRTGRPT